MRRLASAALAALALGLGSAAGPAEPVRAESAFVDASEVKVGDVLTEQADGGWATVKVLAVETWPDGTRVFHCLFYRRSEAKPTLASSKLLPVFLRHAPIDGRSFGTRFERLGNAMPTDEELEGYRFYLEGLDG